MEYKDSSDVITWAHGLIDKLDRAIAGTWITRVFVQGTMYLKWWAPPHLARTQEIDEPFRYARSLIIHVPPFHTGIAIGLWSKTGLKEDEALLRAVRPTRPPTHSELRFWDVDHARDVLFRNGSRRRVQYGRPGLRDGATRHDGSDGRVYRDVDEEFEVW